MGHSDPGHILVVGSMNMDMVVRVHRHPQVGETVVGEDFRNYPGGKGANQAVAAARLGGRVMMIGKVGSDPFGDKLMQSVAENGVDTSRIKRDESSATGVAMITVDEEGDNTIVVASGANARLEPEDITQAASAFEHAAVLLVQLECPISTVEQAIDMAKAQDTRVILDPAPAQLLDTELLKKVDYLTPNRTELAMLSGQDTIEAAFEVLEGHGISQIIVTLGGEGALLFAEGREVQIPAYRVPVVDTTAAGDAFAGALAVALTRGLPVLEAMKWGNAAGALTVTRAGAQPSLPSLEELNQFLATYDESSHTG